MKSVQPSISPAFPKSQILVVVDQDGEFGFPTNLFICSRQSAADAAMPAARVDVDIEVVSKAMFDVEFSIKQNVWGMKIDAYPVIYVNR